MGEISKKEMRERLGNSLKLVTLFSDISSREYDSRIEQIECEISLLQQERRDRLE